MKKAMICTVCPRGCHLIFEDGEVSGNSCPRGVPYAISEVTDPKRNVSSTVILKGSRTGKRRLPVHTDKPIARALLKQAVRALDRVEVQVPVKIGDVVLPYVCGTDVCFVSSMTVKK